MVRPKVVSSCVKTYADVEAKDDGSLRRSARQSAIRLVSLEDVCGLMLVVGLLLRGELMAMCCVGRSVGRIF